jgi:hypothetical protein
MGLRPPAPPAAGCRRSPNYNYTAGLRSLLFLCILFVPIQTWLRQDWNDGQDGAPPPAPLAAGFRRSPNCNYTAGLRSLLLLSILFVPIPPWLRQELAGRGDRPVMSRVAMKGGRPFLVAGMSSTLPELRVRSKTRPRSEPSRRTQERSCEL